MLRKLLRKIVLWVYPELNVLRSSEYDFSKLRSWQQDVACGRCVRINTVALLNDVQIGDYSYLSDNAVVAHTTIGKFCSIGPNLMCGWGMHPTEGISTSPVFYSQSARFTFCTANKVQEHAPIHIGNDVFIGANVTILEGVTIGDGAVIGAGAVVSKDIPPYAVAVGCPITIRRYRFTPEQRQALQQLQWWNWNDEQLRKVEQCFWNVEEFLRLNEQSI